MDLVVTRFDHPDARKLNDEVQAEYAVRYDDVGDLTPLAPEMFDPPHGLYLLAYDPLGRPVATGGWRSRDAAGDEGYRDGDAEIKRMFVVPEARGLGLARRILARLEDDARRAGRTRMVLETGIAQPEAMNLYASSGYTMLPREEQFGFYRHSPSSRCYAKDLRAAGQP
ncbi:GNAT family N-acetyltransferase [Streptomyces sp. 3MP-14]|uniref:GNAT family N-acetyltransferase n=1 Tax=Streptomyces mimosae TaxID=2586635 RepID=A0A5N6A975_9ACTN|nr:MULTISPECIES: GNAT family N-acetyltransferase [Streptomyces]KAB8164310.1 GNAT family N-acetyltransferase [Streptomyces mimosae]KAB8176587.1 GNAT family N-acetyltransferase [Streptomyces sp. 3MP-14]